MKNLLNMIIWNIKNLLYMRLKILKCSWLMNLEIFGLISDKCFAKTMFSKCISVKNYD